jgi:predicted nuclease with TOPRIM domain
MNAPTPNEADVIKAGLQTFLDVIAERDRLRKENELLHNEVELKRARIAAAERDLETAKTELHKLSVRHARMRTMLGRFVEFLGGAEAMLSEAIAGEEEPTAAEAPQTMRTAIVADIRDNLAGATTPEERSKFAEIWGEPQ